MPGKNHFKLLLNWPESMFECFRLIERLFKDELPYLVNYL